MNDYHLVDSLYEVLSVKPSKSHAPTEDEFQLATFLATEVMSDVDIEKTYPEMFNNLKDNPSADNYFIDLISMFNSEKDGLPNVPSEYIPSFMPKVDNPGESKVKILLDTVMISKLFNNKINALGFRNNLANASHAVDHHPFTIMENQIQLGKKKVDFILRGQVIGGRFMHVIIFAEIEEHDKNVLYAQLDWGDYRSNKELQSSMETPFDPIQLKSIMNEAGMIKDGIVLEIGETIEN